MSLRADDVHTGYGRIKVLQGVSIGLGDGEILGVLGRNGMGKTTLIRCLAGLLPSWQGSINLDGEDVTRLPAHERARRGLTTIVQGRGLFPRLTVRENLEMGRIAGGGGKRKPPRRGHRLLPAARRTPWPGRRHTQWRRAANAIDRPRADDASAAHVA